MKDSASAETVSVAGHSMVAGVTLRSWKLGGLTLLIMIASGLERIATSSGASSFVASWV